MIILNIFRPRTKGGRVRGMGGLDLALKQVEQI